MNETWYVTFGLGTPLGGKYSEIVVDRQHPQVVADGVPTAVRTAAYKRYPQHLVAFFYGPHDVNSGKPFRSTLHERIDLDGNVVPTFRVEELLKYDHEKGELQTLIDGQVRSIIEVRKTLHEKLLRQAVIVELERIGYTVISPEGGE